MTIAITRHADDATLMSYAAGTLAEPLAAVVAAHLSMCADCRAEVRDLELVGTALMASIPSGGNGHVVVPARPSDDPIKTGSTQRSVGRRVDRLPDPIAHRYGVSFETIPWKRLAPGIWHHRLALSPGISGDLRLLKISAGRTMPDHGHGGEELNGEW